METTELKPTTRDLRLLKKVRQRGMCPSTLFEMKPLDNCREANWIEDCPPPKGISAVIRWVKLTARGVDVLMKAGQFVD